MGKKSYDANEDEAFMHFYIKKIIWSNSTRILYNMFVVVKL